ncbi:MAG: type II toxin-antitoxin system VapC family toxin [Candidatus Fermentithermobacillus carboniphilus]|uniref:Ribonuclease VapC n=1 Tax=Candidatus Fermentithermobacillus carboniphilus TaxID=3085328 RepID=A0AAT9LEM0_9FIRM|nr:MAG: type II toxin-antitoxin system VapC family toxin [Candidatus Fermentithermobacillus carboniphilus]
MRAKSKRKAEEKYVLDAHSLLAFLEAEKGGEKVKDLLESSGNRVYISAVNLGEVYYIVLRERGKDAAELMLTEFRQAARISVVDATWERAREAGRLKGCGGISYADCFAAALAEEKGAWLVTGDPEFKRVADRVKILWLDGGQAEDR